MPHRNVLVASLLLLPLFSTVAAQPPSLDLEFGGDLYLSHVSSGLEGLDSYRQQSVITTITPAAEGEPTEQRQEEGRAYAESGDLSTFMSFDLMPGNTMVSGQFLVGEQGFLLGGSGEDLSCHAAPPSAISVTPLETQVADATGFRKATLEEAGQTINGVLADYYLLGESPQMGRFIEGSLQGELWLAREGGFIVRYLITGTEPSGKTLVWSYDLTDVGTLDEIALPEACSSL